MDGNYNRDHDMQRDATGDKGEISGINEGTEAGGITELCSEPYGESCSEPYGESCNEPCSEPYKAGESRKRMEEGRLYFPGDEDIMREQTQGLELLCDYNSTRPKEGEKRESLLRQMFGSIGRNCFIEPPLHCNWGGRHVYMGDFVYANYNLTLVDDGEIHIGSHCMFGPNVTIATAGHPVEPELRRKGMQFNMPVRIGENVWIGAGAVLVPGVTIGDNSVIGAGSVVTKDIPANTVAAGNPCRVLREIGERDKKYYYKDREIDM